MNIGKTILAAAVAATAFSAPALAQETEFQLPEQCTTAATAGGMDHSAMGHGNMAGNQGAGMMEMMGMGGMDLESMPEHAQENMRKMMTTMPAMHEGMMMEDADVAFACGMIAHHQGAIDMAEVLLEHGDDPQMRALAEEIIAAQGPEIERMTTWLAENAN
ncbi:CopM family metallochaperone [Cereibacter sphaeroides]|uniref:CopM family metallochaperone n=1 Tax=Cereibacter sphaeroides TaxID=1063 RepID=UPI003FCE5DD0